MKLLAQAIQNRSVHPPVLKGRTQTHASALALREDFRLPDFRLDRGTGWRRLAW